MTTISGHEKFWRGVAQCLIGAGVLAALTVLGFRLQLNLATTGSLYLIVIVVLSLQAAFLASAVVSEVAVWCLDYFFVPPLFSLRVTDPIDIVAIAAFLTTSSVITRLVSRVRA